MQQDEDLERLRELVVDERARRVYAEQELAEERKRTQIWRARAEDRKEALRRRRKPPLRLLRRSRRAQPEPQSSTPVPSAPPPAEKPRPRSRPYQPTLRVAAWHGPDWLEEAADYVDLTEAADAVASADLVLVGGPGAVGVLSEWLTWPARQSLVLWEPEQWQSDEWLAHLIERDLVVGGAPIAPAAHLEPILAVDPRSIRPSDDPEPISTANLSSSLEDIVLNALRKTPVQWDGGPPPEHLKGLVVEPDQDGPKAAVLARLHAVRRHSPAVALDKVTESVGLSLPPSLPLVGILLITRRRDRLQHALQQVARSRYARQEVILGLHGFRDDQEVRALIAEFGLEPKVQVLEFPEELPLGACLNEAAEATGASVLAKFDDDDGYGPWYLDEAVDELTTSGADLVGKATQFVHLTHTDQLLLFQPGKENADVGYVNGPTFVMPRHTWEQVRFPHRRSRVDSIFVRGIKAIGGTIRSTSRFEFVLGRYAEGHTWQATDERFLASSEVVGTGEDRDLVWLEGSSDSTPPRDRD